MDELGEERQAPYWGYTFDEHNFEIIEGKQSLWITTRFPEGGHLAMGAAYCPECELTIDEIRQLGNFLVEIHLPQAGRPWLHYHTTFNPIAPLLKLDHIERMNENQGPEPRWHSSSRCLK